MPEYKEEDPKTHRKKIEVQYASINGNGFWATASWSTAPRARSP